MKKLITACVFVLGLGILFDASAQVMPIASESLLFMEIPSVITASKTEQDIRKAPSVVTVVTAADIKLMGAKNIEEVLMRVAGFFPKPTRDWDIIASRGIDADMNHQYLMLIDGHNINSVNGWGARNQQVLPLLYQVKRVEVIRGPGSTLWGSDAAMGIINIITKDGGEVGGAQVGYDYSFLDRQYSTNLLAGEKFKNGDFMVSATFFDSAGFHEKDGTPNYVHLNGASASSRSWQKFQDFNPSGELYGKASYGPFGLLFRSLNWDEVYRDNEIDARQDRTYEHNYVELTHKKPFGKMSLESRLFWDNIKKGQGPVGDTVANKDSYKENGIGGEMMLKIDTIFLKRNHNFRAGVRFVTVDIGDNNRVSYDPSLNRSIAEARALTASGTDSTLGVYAEDQFDVTDKLNLIAGVRFDNNDFREEKSIFLPRGGAIYKLSDKLTAKYLYNSGYIRPAVNQGQSVFPGRTNATKGQAINCHDWQILYAGPKTNFSFVVFYMPIRDYITYVAGYQNVSDGHTAGIESDFRRKLIGETLALYGNYSYAYGKISNRNAATVPAVSDSKGRWNGVPLHIFNLGVDWFIKKGLSLNLHARGWLNAHVYDYDPELGINHFEVLEGQGYLDANIVYAGVCGLPLDISLYCTNILDRGGREPLYQIGWYKEEGRCVGTKVIYKF